MITQPGSKMTVGTTLPSHLAASNMARPMMKNFPMNFFSSPPNQTHQLTDTKGLLNGPGQNNCFLNCAVQVSAEPITRSQCGCKSRLDQ